MRRIVVTFSFSILLFACAALAQNSKPTYVTTLSSSLPPDIASQKLSDFPVDFPLHPLAESQIKDVKMCDIENIVHERYPVGIDEDQLDSYFDVRSNCDWAVLAFAYALRNQTDIHSLKGIDALKNALSDNYGYMLSDRIFFEYFGAVPLVKNPSFVDQEIVSITIEYSWFGLGNPSSMEYSLAIVDANTQPVIQSTSQLIDTSVKPDKDVIQGMKSGLSDLLPINKSKISIASCTDNFPQWLVQIKFVDDTELTMETTSNVLSLGGPWETTVNNQTYLQVSPAFAEKIYELVVNLNLPLGQPDGMLCKGDIVFEKAFLQPLLPSKTPLPDPALDALLTQVVGGALTQVSDAQTVVALTPTP